MHELIYYVDQRDTPTGETEEKYAAHHANTRLHAAFSCYVFNDKDQFLVTQRAFIKKVWPEVWTNTACGHPMPGESREHAMVRRLQYELGMKIKDVQLVLPNYTYQTPPYNGIIEHEFCPVYFARAASDPVANSTEVAMHHWMDWADYIAVLEADGQGSEGERDWMGRLATSEYRKLGVWSWWCKDQLKQLKNHPLLAEYTKTD